MSPELVNIFAAIVGAVLAFAFEFFPGIKIWFEGLTKGTKQLVFGGVAVVIGVIAFGLSCAGFLANFFPELAIITCDIPGVFILLQVVVAVVGGAQFTHITINKIIHKVARLLK